jgi:hypothetical protein
VAKAVREFAVQTGVWRHADRQNDGVLVEYPGMLNKGWWALAAEGPAALQTVAAAVEADFAAIKSEALALLAERVAGAPGTVWQENVEAPPHDSDPRNCCWAQEIFSMKIHYRTYFLGHGNNVICGGRNRARRSRACTAAAGGSRRRWSRSVGR